MSGRRRSRRGVSRLRVWVGAILLGVLLGIWGLLATGDLQVYQVPSESMTPTIQVGDYILVDAGRPVVPGCGDIVALRNPKDPADLLLKRVVAGPLDVVEFRGGEFYRNGEWQMEEYVRNISRRRETVYYRRKLKADEYFVLGDNRAVSFDSVDFGPVTSKDFIGIAVRIYWPLGRARWLRAGE